MNLQQLQISARIGVKHARASLWCEGKNMKLYGGVTKKDLVIILPTFSLPPKKFVHISKTSTRLCKNA